ncbi:MAG: T9SS type A sorting domain-containing protein [Bacteroidetes bacterium]|nr:MAG: T9SS type A sorting domain-containing protein [Bacteroidota bacterium]
MILARGFFIFLGLFIFLVSKGQNAAPNFGTFPKSKTVFVRVQACVSLSTQDSDETDTVRLSVVSSSVAGQWATNSGSVKLASGELCVTPTDQDAGATWSFVFMAHDGKDSTLDTFYVHVIGLPARHAFRQEELGCGKWSFQAEANVWATEANIVIRDVNSTGVYAKAFANVEGLIGDTVQLAAGAYTLYTDFRDTKGNLRYYVDSIYVSQGIEVRIEGMNSLSRGETVYLKGKVLAGETPFKTYWVVERNGIAQTMAEDTNYYAQPQYETTTYRYIAQGKDLCLYEDSKTVESIDATGINSPLNASLKFYPNPARDKIRIETAVESGVLSLYDAKGKQVQMHRYANQLVPEMNLTNLPAGIYFVRLQDLSGQTWTAKLIKE